MVRGGASLVEREPVFSSDGKRLLVCTACAVSVYSVATGLLATQLRGHTGVVTTVVVVAQASLQHAWTSSVDGTIRMWDYSTGALLRTVTVGMPIHSMAIPDLRKPVAPGRADGKARNLVAFLSVTWSKVCALHSSCRKEGLGLNEFRKARLSNEEARTLQRARIWIEWPSMVRSSSHEQSVMGMEICNVQQKEPSWDDFTGRVVLHNLTTGKPLLGHLAKMAFPQALYVAPSGGLVGMVDTRKIWIWKVPPGSLESASSIPCTLLHHRQMMTALAFDSTETRVAAGDQRGRILIWENVGERDFVTITSDGTGKSPGEKSLTPHKTKPEVVERGGVLYDDDANTLTTYHWHAHEVKFLLFSSDGVHLLSGGMEGVLVIWQLETGRRQYLPRLGGPVVSIAASLNASFYAISCLDNAVKFVNIGRMEVERSIQGIKPPFLLPNELRVYPSRACVEPQEGRIVVPTHNLSLQFYDAASDSHVAELQVTPRNYITGGSRNGQQEGPSTFVTHVAFSADGSSMATVDVRMAEQGIGRGACLKFWDRQPGRLQYSTNTQIDELHDISSVLFHPQELMAVSCSDVSFKVWIPTSHNKSSRLSWRCRSVGSYRQKPILAAAFSPDGSLLAVAASDLLTLWNPSTNGLIRVLSNSIQSLPIIHLAFVNQSNCLVSATSGDRPLLTVWDLKTLSVRWSQQIHVEALAVDPARPNFSVLAGVPSTSKTKGVHYTEAFLVLFGVDSPVPLRYWTVQDGMGGTVLYFPNAPAPPAVQGDENQAIGMEIVTSSVTSSLAVITKCREFALFNPYQDEDEPEQVLENMPLLDPISSSVFTAMYGKMSNAKKKGTPLEVRSAIGKAPWGTVLDCPSHVFPPLSVVCISFMDHLLQKRTTK